MLTSFQIALSLLALPANAQMIDKQFERLQEAHRERNDAKSSKLAKCFELSRNLSWLDKTRDMYVAIDGYHIDKSGKVYHVTVGRTYHDGPASKKDCSVKWKGFLDKQKTDEYRETILFRIEGDKRRQLVRYYRKYDGRISRQVVAWRTLDNQLAQINCIKVTHNEDKAESPKVTYWKSGKGVEEPKNVQRVEVQVFTLVREGGYATINEELSNGKTITYQSQQYFGTCSFRFN